MFLLQSLMYTLFSQHKNCLLKVQVALLVTVQAIL